MIAINTIRYTHSMLRSYPQDVWLVPRKEKVEVHIVKMKPRAADATMVGSYTDKIAVGDFIGDITHVYRTCFEPRKAS